MNTYIIVIIIFIIIVSAYILVSNMKIQEEVKENFCEADTESNDNYNAYQERLPQNLKNQISNMINDNVINILNSAGKLIPGPRGERGIKGPPGSKYQIYGRLVNKVVSYNNDSNFNNSVCDNSLKFVKSTIEPNMYWYLTEDNQIKNKFEGDNQCLSYNISGNKAFKLQFLDCDNDDTNVVQKWFWDENNRITDGNKNCLKIEGTENNFNMVIDKCNENGGVNKEETWGFI